VIEIRLLLRLFTFALIGGVTWDARAVASRHRHQDLNHTKSKSCWKAESLWRIRFEVWWLIPSSQTTLPSILSLQQSRAQGIDLKGRYNMTSWNRWVTTRRSTNYC